MALSADNNNDPRLSWRVLLDKEQIPNGSKIGRGFRKADVESADNNTADGAQSTILPFFRILYNPLDVIQNQLYI